MEIETEVIDCMNDILDIVDKKEKKRLYYIQYREKNKGKISQQKKQYNQENREKILAYREKNREKILQQKREYYEENKEKISKRQKEYYEENKESILTQQKEYQKKPERVKVRRIKDWKKLGVICDDFDALYDKYMNTTHCEECNVLLTYDTTSTATTKCLDHCHETGMFRNILCNVCNLQRR